MFFAPIVGRLAQYDGPREDAAHQVDRHVRSARQAFLVTATGDALWMIALTFVGLALFAYVQHTPPPAGVASDRFLPDFMAQVFPIGAVGLVNAAILAASLSSVDAAIHSSSPVLVVDGYIRLLAGSTDDKAQVRAARIAAVLVGAAGTRVQRGGNRHAARNRQ
jgi:Na+/proline symporter